MAICVTFEIGSVRPLQALSIDLLILSALNASFVPSLFVICSVMDSCD